MWLKLVEVRQTPYDTAQNIKQINTHLVISAIKSHSGSFSIYTTHLKIGSIKIPTNSYLSYNYQLKWTLRLIDVHHSMLVFIYSNASSSLTELISHFVLTLFFFLLMFRFIDILRNVNRIVQLRLSESLFTRGPNHQYFSFWLDIAHTVH